MPSKPTMPTSMRRRTFVGADDGNEAALDEVDMADRLARCVKDAADLELHRVRGQDAASRHLQPTTAGAGGWHIGWEGVLDGSGRQSRAWQKRSRQEADAIGHWHHEAGVINRSGARQPNDRRALPVAPPRSERQADVPSQARRRRNRAVDDVDQAWTTICALLADAELVVFRGTMGGSQLRPLSEGGGASCRRPPTTAVLSLASCPPAGTSNL